MNSFRCQHGQSSGWGCVGWRGKSLRVLGVGLVFLGAISVVSLQTGFCAETSTSEAAVLRNIGYKPGSSLSDYEKERCRLDLYVPKGSTLFPTLVWFHGGGLTAGSKDEVFSVRIAQCLAQAGVAVALANYRLSPHTTFPGYIEDAAAAFAWVRTQIAEHGGDPGKVFVGGHSAGAYLTLMVGLDSRYLQKHGMQTGAIAGLIPVSGQAMTHYTIREERGLDKGAILADEAAPIHYVRKETPPLLVLYAERDLPARAEENAYLVAALKAAGNLGVTEKQIVDRDHGSIAGKIPEPRDPGAEAILSFIASTSAMRPSFDPAKR